MPGYAGSSEAASVAYWHAYDAYLKDADEHRGVKVVALHTHGGAQLMSAEPVTVLAQAEGMKVRIPGGVASDVGAALGMVGIQVPATKVYETLASRAADGVVMPIDSRVGFKLTEVAQNMYMLPGGLYRGSFAFIMNEDTFADLPEDIQQALEEKVFGEAISRAIGAIWDEGDAEAIEATLASPGNAIHDATPEDAARFDEIARAVRAKVIEEVAATGVDAQAAYQMIKAEMSAY
ncbi:MAG: TRAP transporter substrate-binding protein DctP [Rhodovulum sp.]